MRLRQLGGAFAALLLASCSEGTSILIEVTSDFEAPAELDGLRIEVRGAESGSVLEPSFVLTSPFPHSYRAHASSEFGSEAVTITVTGLTGTRTRVRRVARSSFTSGTHGSVTVHLPRSCEWRECPQGIDCVDGVCIGVVLDGGVDAGRDADLSDGGCIVDGHCDDGIACTADTCAGGTCASAPDDSRCGAGEVCHPLTGCELPCAGDADCDDEVFCNGVEVCAAERCMPGTAPDCGDALECTDDRCDEASSACVNEPVHARCDDADACNGVETCEPIAGCTPGAPLDCDDASDCSVDSCASGACVHRTRDGDGDGYGDALCPALGGVSADDCDDTDASVRPGAPEVCNGTDDDCDGSTDEGFTCRFGELGACTTSCGSTGSRTCSAACSWSVCAAPSEICNGADDDCNGAADEGFGCVQGETRACTTSCGTTGTRLCDGDCVLGECTAPVEVCEDGIDQDCDGVDTLCAACPSGTDEECDDGRPCNGVETCHRGSCAPGTVLACDDGVRCTVDTCEDAAGGCVYTPDDRLCADASFCNGAETCDEVLGCRTGAAPTCDDTDACTEDACAGAGAGACLNTTRDADNDGHGDDACTEAGGVPADDCDDTRATVYLGAPELCNGRDDDCDTICDDGFSCCQGTTGSCTTSCGTTGTRMCSSVCSWGLCSPPAETCNGVDDDCNGACDDAFACCQGSTGGCITSCGSMGSRTCGASCGWGSCEMPVESCSGVDDDCDGEVDEGFACRAGALGSCTTSCGSTGRRTCSASCEWGSCEAPVEECNGLDDDCDGAVDEGFLCASGASRSCMSSCGSTGTQACSAGCTWGVCLPPVELCNGLDDDCNTFIDNGFSCASGASGACTSSCGTPGSRTCDASCEWGSCTPPTEVCNGADDDCDTLCDDGFTCCRGSSGACTTSCGSTGSRLCGASCAWGSCTAPAEVCNGVDDDCDATADEGFTCVAGSSGSCTSSCGTPGSRTCDASCAWGSCTPPTEVCNGIDDDCDTTADEGFTCRAGSSEACTTTCGTTGSRTCSGSCAWGACVPPPEACNGIDDDCNGTIDDALECVSGAAGMCTTSCGSTGTRSCGVSCTWGSCAPPAELCNGADDDCDGLVDDGFACPAGSSGSCSTTCGSTGTRVCSGSCAWGSCTAPVEVCNGVDDDCDGLVDETYTCIQGGSGACTTSCGSSGTRTCGAACSWGSCIAPAEICNGEDDDCDTLIDEGFTCASGATATCLSSCGTTGTRTCDASCGWGSCNPPVESCNGADDDCDGLIDDGFTCAQGSGGSCTTSCGSTGSRTCSGSCAWGACNAPGESCNGADDDCDGSADEDFVCVRGASGSCLTSCGSTGARSCGTSCTWNACVPPTELCNGADDDCDGLVDDGFTCAVGATDSCTTSCGTTGTRTCTGACAWGSCTAPAEVCNGVDDDCDGTIDEGFTCVPGANRSCTASCGTSGSQTCTAACAWSACTAPAESCNGADDDCDSFCDNGFACCQGSMGACTTSCGTTGSRTCSGSCAWGACNAPAEVCNGADDDCDTVCDDGFACCQGSVGTCTTGCGSTGSRSCGATCAWGSCIAPAEICNGLDDDCDSTCDNGFTCCQGSSGSCTTSCGSTGSRTCSAACNWGTCSAPAETCNGADDDCDSVCDNGFACCRGSTESCTASCGSTGTRTCASDCGGYGACTPPAEVCDSGGDEDCDGLTNCADPDCASHPSCTSCASCPGAATVTAPGGRYTVVLGADAHAGSCGGAGGSEGYLTLQVTAVSDVFITTHAAGIDTVLYVRDCNCAGPELGCNDNADGYTTSLLRLTNLAVGTYQIFVDTKAPMSASVPVHVYVTTPGAPSDRCGNPTLIPAGAASVSGNTCAYGADYQPVAGGECYVASGGAVERVYYFVQPGPGARTVTFSGCGAGNYDQTTFLRTTCTDGAASAQVACNDDGCTGGAGCTGNRYRSVLSTSLAPGIYFFFADGYGSGTPACACGDFTYALAGI